jgi:hypothetical protein
MVPAPHNLRSAFGGVGGVPLPPPDTDGDGIPDRDDGGCGGASKPGGAKPPDH